MSGHGHREHRGVESIDVRCPYNKKQTTNISNQDDHEQPTHNSHPHYPALLEHHEKSALSTALPKAWMPCLIRPQREGPSSPEEEERQNPRAEVRLFSLLWTQMIDAFHPCSERSAEPAEHGLELSIRRLITSLRIVPGTRKRDCLPPGELHTVQKQLTFAHASGDNEVRWPSTWLARNPLSSEDVNCETSVVSPRGPVT
jgi:hypothetical protein